MPSHRNGKHLLFPGEAPALTSGVFMGRARPPYALIAAAESELGSPSR